MNSLAGENILTVLLAKPSGVQSTKMFFCPYTRNITTNYKGDVRAITPGHDPDEPTIVMIKPRRMDKDENIYYSFKEVEGGGGGAVDFWIQDQYFVEQAIRTYHCYNCQAPNLYFAGNKTVMFSNKSDVLKGQTFDCINPLCKQHFRYHGIVKIVEVTDTVE